MSLNIESAWNGDWFEPFFLITALYFAVDLAWVILVPKCVRSPGTIVQHHIATLLYILIPKYDHSTRWIMGACMSVEVNTWFLIARRVFNKQGLPPWNIGLPPLFSVRVKLVSILFYATWFSIRVGLYPLIWVQIRSMWSERVVSGGSRLNALAVALVLHTVFCALNFKWTHDLIMSKMRYWKRLRNARRGGGDMKMVMGVDKGL